LNLLDDFTVKSLFLKTLRNWQRKRRTRKKEGKKERKKAELEREPSNY